MIYNQEYFLILRESIHKKKNNHKKFLNIRFLVFYKES